MKSGRSRAESIPSQRTWFEHFRFRSQVEARWAVFFRSMELDYEYEGRWFDLGDGVRYLPDFWLPSLHCWIEVKGVVPTAREREKARRLARHTRSNVYIFYGSTLYFRVPLQTPDDEGWYSYSAEAFFAAGGEDDAYWWCACPACGSLGLAEEGRAARLPCGCLGGAGSRLDRSHHYYSARLIAAYDRARNAEAVRLDGRDEYVLVPDDS